MKRHVPLVVFGLVVLLHLGGPALGPLFGITLAPMPRVRFDQTVPDVPPQVLLGEDFTFQVRFRNQLALASEAGYGVFVDVVLPPGANIAKGAPIPPCVCDGVTFLQASLTAVNGGPLPLTAHVTTAPCSPVPATVSLTHPFTGVLPVTVPAGSQLVTLELPFGSFDPTQPELVIQVTAHTSSFADVNVPLNISARGGFRYGADPLNNAPPDYPVVSDLVTGTPPNDQQVNSTQWAAQAQTTPSIFTISKAYLGPENETATGPNFPRQYQITLDVATGQTIHNVVVIDHLPINMAFSHMVSSSPACFTATTPVAGAPHLPPNNDLTLQCSGSITGVPGPDGTFVFEFFIPQFDANGVPVLSPTSCSPVASVNDIEAQADWSPADSCDTSPVHVVSNVTPADHTLSDKCLAIQKSVADLSGVPPAHPIPGDTLQYTLSAQLSDFETAGHVKIKDVLSDGQTLVASSLTLAVVDQCGTTSGPIPTSAWSQTPLACGAGAPPPHTQLDIDVSAAMIALAGSTGPLRHQSGIVTGGWAFAPGSTSTVPAIITITFQTHIDDAYQCPAGAGHDVFVDKDDPLDNSVTVTADVLTNSGSCATIPPSAGFTAQDGSAAALNIAGDTLVKSIWAVIHGSTETCGPNTVPCPAKPQVVPGDQVVFSLRKTIFSGDAENLTLHDWLPLPYFLAAGQTFSSTPCSIPAVGASCPGPLNTLPVTPVYTADGLTNSIQWAYPNFNNPANTPQTIQILFTRVVTNTPAADGLFATNDAQECESNTFGATFCQIALGQVQVREPSLRVTKGIIDATNPNAVFTPAVTGPVVFLPPGSCPRFNTPITSGGLALHPINSDVANVDANDCVTFAIVVENTGGAPAYDVKLREIYPLDPVDRLECFSPDFSTLCVTDGSGAPLPFTTGIGRSLPISLGNPLPATNTSGSNLAVLTFQACILADVKPDCCVNTARIENYSSTPGGPNYAGAGFDGPLEDSARLCILPKATKSIAATSEAHTGGQQLAIGEIVRYHLEVVVPETTAINSYQLQDVLPPGLLYLGGSTTVATKSAGLTATNFPPLITGTPSCNGSTMTFDFGNVTNPNNSSAQELLTVDFNALVCNVFSNQDATQLVNTLNVLLNGTQIATATAAASVVEPNIVVTKNATATSLTLNGTAHYTVTLTNNGSATAFDVHLTDTLPQCLTGVTGVSVSVPATNSSTPAKLDVTVSSIAVGGTVTVQYDATITCLDCTKLINVAAATWTSLPGPFGTTVNPTGSATPGASGFTNGERNGAGGVNDYSAFATATLCCLLESNDSLSCNPGGGYSYTFTLTNNKNTTIAGVGFTPTSPPNVTITPGGFTGLSILPFTSATFTVTVGGAGAVPGATLCFTTVTAATTPGGDCIADHCVPLPNCCVTPPASMVAWYPLDETAGTSVVNDIAPAPGSNVNNAGTTFNAPVGGSVSPIAVTGEVHGALYFGGGYVEAPSQSEIEFTGGKLSIDGWIRGVTCTPILSPIVDKFDPNSNRGFAFYLTQPTPGVAFLNFRLNGSTFTSTSTLSATASPLANIGPWYHVAVTVDTSTGAGVFYLNGAQAGSFAAASSPFNNLVPLWIGKTRLPNSSCEIAVDELELFDRALTQAELQGIYNAGSAGKCALGMLCVTNFNDLNRNGVRDANEPLIPGFTFRVTDRNRKIVGTATTSSCLALPPGTYTVTELATAGYAPTTPASRSVTIAAGQKATVTFGNILTRRHAVGH